MNRNDKQDWITSLNSALSSSESAVVAKFNALTVSEMSDLRNEARKLGMTDEEYEKAVADVLKSEKYQKKYQEQLKAHSQNDGFTVLGLKVQR